MRPDCIAYRLYLHFEVVLRRQGQEGLSTDSPRADMSKMREEDAKVGAPEEQVEPAVLSKSLGGEPEAGSSVVNTCASQLPTDDIPFVQGLAIGIIIILVNRNAAVDGPVDVPKANVSSHSRFQSQHVRAVQPEATTRDRL